MDFKKAGYVFALPLLLAGGVFFYFHDTPTTENTVIAQTVKPNTQLTESHTSQVQGNIDKATAAVITDKTHNELTQEDVLEFIDWQYEHGYPLVDQHGELIPTGYESYSEETLIILADQGDARAMLVLGTQKMMDGNFDTAEKYLLDSTIRGYTISLGTLAGIKFIQAKKNAQANNTAVNSEQIESAFAWMEVGLMRGDKALLFTKSAYERTHPQDKVGRQKINIRAKLYYDQLNQQRIQMGLGEFDNTYPKAMDVIFSQ